MFCPVCNETKLVMTDRQGIEIDYCPDCRGVWLDRGELDKIIERSLAQPASHTTAPTSPAHSPQYEQPREPIRQHDFGHGKKDGHHYKTGHPEGYKKKKESFWGEIFDFD